MPAPKRPLFPTVLILLAAGAAATGFSYVRTNVMRHPSSGQPVIVPGQDGDATLLHSGWKITPSGRHLQTSDLLLSARLSPDGKTLAIVSAGYNVHALHLIDVASEKEIANLPLTRAGGGLVWSPDGKRIFVGGGANNGLSHIHVVAKGDTGRWSRLYGMKLPGADTAKTYVSGMSISSDGGTLYALNMSDDKLYAMSAADGAAKFTLAVGDHPSAICLDRSGRTAYIANLGGEDVAVVDVGGAANASVLRRFKVSSHPNDLALGTDGRLFVSCGAADVVSVVDAGSGVTEESVRTGLSPRAPLGSTPNALALAADGKKLYVVNADNNNLCIIDVANRKRSRVLGFVPTGWYPTAVAVSTDGSKVIVGSGKGTGIRANMPRDPERVQSFQHMGRQLNGLVSFIDTPGPEDLARFSRQVAANSPYRDELLGRLKAPAGSPIPSRVGGKSPIKYVLYIIKENRTYDQVFGALPQGNGDPKLVLFGRDVTPNHHALAEEFVLLDNLYCNGEVSQDGHPWTASAYVTEFTQRAWVNQYSGKSQPTGGRTVTDPPAGYLWEQAAKKGLSVRNYGEMRGHPSWNGKESDPFIGKVGPNQVAPGRDYEKADIFIQEFKEFEKNGTIPRLMVMSLGEDHTRGTAVGANTPKACVASNDLALGKIVDAISKSSVWKEFAIFVIEDDAQNGPDHIDSHRTIGLVISPYTKRKSVDSTMYQTASMLRTMELILGLDPLTQYDAGATPMYLSFTDKPNLATYNCLPARIDLGAKNGTMAYGARESAKMDWTEYDRIDEAALNRILWRSIKGEKSTVPPPVRSVWVNAGEE